MSALPIALPPHPAAAAAAPVRLQASGIGFGHAGKPVFHGLDLAVRQGEFVALVGPSGCGKSTLLNLLSGFLVPSTGRATLDGAPVRPELATLGYVFQSPQLFPWLNVLDNVCFGLKMAGALPRPEQRARAEAALALVDMAGSGALLPHQLSGGMRQRVALARALVPQPSVLLADEPFGALDAITRRRLNEELLQLTHRLGQTVVLVTHDVDEAVFLADRVIVLAPAPHGIDSEHQVALPRPRTQADVTRHPTYLALREQLLARIATVMKAPR